MCIDKIRKNSAEKGEKKDKILSRNILEKVLERNLIAVAFVIRGGCIFWSCNFCAGTIN